MKFRSLAAAFAAVASLAAAQGSACGTPFTTWNITAQNGQNGVMFDVENISCNTVTICGMDINLDSSAAQQTIGVWTVTAGTSHVPVASTAAAWTQQALGPTTSLGINTTGIGNTFTPIPSALSITIASGQRLGFAVACSTGTLVNYQTGTAATQSVGMPMSNDGTLKWYAGFGKAYLAGVGPFGGSFGTATTGGRLASVRLGYTSGPPSFAPSWELNSAASSLDINGVSTQLACGLNAAVSNQCVGVSSNVALNSTNVGFPFDVVYGSLPLAPGGSAGSFATANGQLVNVDVTDPNLGFLLGLAFTSPFANAVIPFSSPVPLAISSQLLNIDVSNPDGFALSAAARFQVNPIATSLTLGQSALADDGFVSLPSGLAPTFPACLGTGPVMPFYGTNYTQTFVASNGRVLFGASANAGDFSPTATEPVTQSPSMGFWVDLEPNLSVGCSLVVDWSTSVVTVAYNNMRYWGNAALFLNGSMSLDTATGVITLSGMNTFPVFPVTAGSDNNMFLGISRGGGLATNPGPTAFAAAGSGSAALATDMLYVFGQAGTLAPGVASIAFTPNMGGGYDWAGF